MSIQIMTKVWDGFPGDGSRLLALLCLADMANDNAICWPSIRTIARKIRLSHSQTQRVVHSLIDDGFITVVGNHAGGAPGATRYYRIEISALTDGMDATDRIDVGDGSHGCVETGSAHATQTINESSVTVNKESARNSSRLPINWKPDEGLLNWAMDKFGWTEQQTIDVAERFSDYWAAMPGSKGLKADWAATWRNWCRNERLSKTAKPISARTDFTETDYTKSI